LLELAVDGDQVRVTESRDVGEGTVGRVEVLGGRESDAGGEVGRDGGVLPRRTSNIRGETTTRSDESARISASNFGLGSSTLVGLASRSLVGVAVDSTRDHSSTN